jgi:ABC-type multidrug transport system permease subunit
MENSKDLFELQLDMTAKDHLRDTAKWARFLAIAGLAGLSIIVVVSAIVAIAAGNEGVNTYDDPASRSAEIAGTIIGMLILVALYFFPCYFLLRFAAKMNRALVGDDTVALNESLRNLKITFRYLGVVTIIFIVLFAIGMLSNLGER